MQNLERKLTKRNKGFSLAELTIAIVIISILLAGVLTVSSLTHNARVQTFIKELNRINVAVELFEQQYDDLPGDISTAQAIFGASACPDHATYAALDCNGDSNGSIGSIYAADGALYEHSYVFLHLKLAGLYEGVFTPQTYSGSYIYGINGENTPSFNVDGSTGYYAFWNGNHKNYRYSMEPNAISSASGNQEKPYQPALRGTTVAKIDRKIDDGRGGNGVLKVSTGTGGACSYTSKDIVCRITIYEWR